MEIEDTGLKARISRRFRIGQDDRFRCQLMAEKPAETESPRGSGLDVESVRPEPHLLSDQKKAPSRQP